MVQLFIKRYGMELLSPSHIQRNGSESTWWVNLFLYPYYITCSYTSRDINSWLLILFLVIIRVGWVGRYGG